MDRKTFEALKRIIDITRYIYEDQTGPGDTNVMKDVRQVEGWMDEVAKEIDD